MQEYSIKQAAKKVGVAHGTFRTWVDEGLVRFRRRDDGHRSVKINQHVIEELQAIKEGYGFNTRLLTATLKIFQRNPAFRQEALEDARAALEAGHE